MDLPCTYTEHCNRHAPFDIPRALQIAPTNSGLAWSSPSPTPSAQRENLNQIGFVWDAQEAAWDERYDELVSYKKIHGDTLVCQASQLGNWVDNQRKEYQLLQRGKHSNLTNKRIGKLDQIGFVWSVLEDAWEEKFAELVEFKAAHGHTDVPKSWENQQLFWWVSVQRREYRKLKEGKITGITEERIQRLEDLGIVAMRWPGSKR